MLDGFDCVGDKLGAVSERDASYAFGKNAVIELVDFIMDAEHIAELNRKGVREFAEAMRRRELDPDTIVDWAIAGADGLADLVESIR